LENLGSIIGLEIKGCESISIAHDNLLLYAFKVIGVGEIRL
jgi:hypothetical protein